MGGLGETLVRGFHHTMYPNFDIDGLSVDRLLSEWRWLSPGDFRLVAVNAFGGLFLEDEHGAIHWLDTPIGKLTRISENLEEFKRSIQVPTRRREWFAEDVAGALANRDLIPIKGQCLGYKTPILFSESTGAADNIYIADLHEYVSFLGDLHFQMKDLPNGSKVRLIVGKRPEHSNSDIEMI